MPLINDRIAAFGLFIVALTAWGSNIFGSQAYMINCVGLAALAFMTRDHILIAFGLYCSAWFAIIQIAESQGWMPQDSMVQAVDVLTLIMSGYALYIVVRYGRASVEFWKNAICILAAILSCVGMAQYYFVGQATATLGCTNFLAAFLAIGALSAFRRKWWLTLLLILPCLYLTHTATAIAAFLVGAGFLFWKWKGAGLSIIPGVAYVLIFKGPDSLLLRLDYWIDAIVKLSGSWEAIIFGTGPSIYWQTGNMLHSEPVYLLWNFGLIGCVIAALYIIRACRNTWWDRALFASFLAILVDGLGNHPFHIAPTAYLAVVIMGLNDRNLVEA